MLLDKQERGSLLSQVLTIFFKVKKMILDEKKKKRKFKRGLRTLELNPWVNTSYAFGKCLIDFKSYVEQRANPNCKSQEGLRGVQRFWASSSIRKTTEVIRFKMKEIKASCFIL